MTLTLYAVYSYELGLIDRSILLHMELFSNQTKLIIFEYVEKTIPSVEHPLPGTVWVIDVFVNIQLLKKPDAHLNIRDA